MMIIIVTYDGCEKASTLYALFVLLCSHLNTLFRSVGDSYYTRFPPKRGKKSRKMNDPY